MIAINIWTLLNLLKMILLVFVSVFCWYWKLLSLLPPKLQQSRSNVNKIREYL